MSEKKNLRIKKQYSIIAHSPNIVELRCGVWNPTSFTLTDAAESGHLFNLLYRLDGSLSPSQLAQEENVAQEEMEALLDHLIQLGIVESSSSNSLDHYLENIAPGWGWESAEREEIGSLPVVLLSDTNLSQEIQRYLKGSLPNIDLSVTNVEDPVWSILLENDTSWLLNGFEFQKKVEVFEKWRNKFLIVTMKIVNPVQLRILNRICLEYQIPWIYAALDGPFIFIGPIFIPYRSACYECFETRLMMNLREATSYQQYKRAIVEAQVKYGSLPVEPVLSGLLASHTAFETLNYLLTRSSSVVGKVLGIYLPTMEFTFTEVLRVAGCTACSPSPERDDTHLYFDMRAFIR